mgnify:CR=1 FL=1
MKGSTWMRFVMMLVSLAAGSYAVGIGSCAQMAANNFNPCGTLFPDTFCTPEQWTQMVGNYRPQDWARDPTCAIPYMCGPWPPADPSTTGGTTTTNTNTTGTTTNTGTGTNTTNINTNTTGTGTTTTGLGT